MASPFSPAEYDRWYDTPRGAWIGQREADLVYDTLAPQSGESLVDVGCGTGYFTRAISQRHDGEVTGVDLDPAMIEYASSRRAGRESYHVGDARALPYADSSFDMAMTVTALCFIDDETTAVREIVRIARRRVVIGLLNRHSLLWFKEGGGRASGGYEGARWHTVVEARKMLTGLGLVNVRVRTGIQIPSGGPCARLIERALPPMLGTGAFILVAGDTPEARTT